MGDAEGIDFVTEFHAARQRRPGDAVRSKNGAQPAHCGGKTTLFSKFLLVQFGKLFAEDVILWRRFVSTSLSAITSVNLIRLQPHRDHWQERSANCGEQCQHCWKSFCLTCLLRFSPGNCNRSDRVQLAMTVNGQLGSCGT